MKHKLLDESKSGASDTEAPPQHYIPYLQARSLLADRIEAEPEEIALWSFVGPENGGLTAYLDPYIYMPPIKLLETFRMGPDYLSPLTTCWFRVEEISAFLPTERYLSSARLLARWNEQLGPQAEGFIKAMVYEGELSDFHPHTGCTQWRQDDHYPAREWAIFPLNQVKQIEARYFVKNPIATNQNGVSGVSAKRIIIYFNFWEEARWKALLSKPPMWLGDARIKPVLPRKAASWNPAEIGNCLLAYRLKYWYATSGHELQYARTIPSPAQIGRIIRNNFPEWFKDWQPELD